MSSEPGTYGGGLLTEPEAAVYLRLHVNTLRKLRADGAGPDWFRVSDRLIRYRRADLNEWLEGRRHTATDGKERGAG